MMSLADGLPVTIIPLLFTLLSREKLSHGFIPLFLHQKKIKDVINSWFRVKRPYPEF